MEGKCAEDKSTPSENCGKSIIQKHKVLLDNAFVISL